LIRVLTTLPQPWCLGVKWLTEIIVHSSARSNGLKLHATVADAVASMKYLSKSQARAALAGQELLEVES
jgi:hypothetical protein